MEPLQQEWFGLAFKDLPENLPPRHDPVSTVQDWSLLQCASVTVAVSAVAITAPQTERARHFLLRYAHAGR